MCLIQMNEETKIDLFAKLSSQAANHLACIVEATNSNIGQKTLASLRLLVTLLSYCRYILGQYLT